MIANGPFSVKEMSKMLGRSEKTVYRMLEDGKLKGYKELDKWRIFLPSRDNYKIISPDMSSTQDIHVRNISHSNADSVETYNGQEKNVSGHFVKGLFLGVVLVVLLIKVLEIFEILEINWF